MTTSQVDDRQTIHLEDKHFSVGVDILVNRLWGFVPTGTRDIEFVFAYYNDETPTELVWNTQDGQPPSVLPAADDPELFVRLAEYCYAEMRVKYREERPENFDGFTTDFYPAVEQPGVQAYRIDDRRSGYRWTYLIALSRPDSDVPALVPGVVYHYGSTHDKDVHLYPRLQTFDEVRGLMDDPNALVITDTREIAHHKVDDPEVKARFDLDNRIVVWDLVEIQRKFAEDRAAKGTDVVDEG
jgi:hypothetical protein